MLKINNFVSLIFSSLVVGVVIFFVIKMRSPENPVPTSFNIKKEFVGPPKIRVVATADPSLIKNFPIAIKEFTLDDILVDSRINKKFPILFFSNSWNDNMEKDVFSRITMNAFKVWSIDANDRKNKIVVDHFCKDSLPCYVLLDWEGKTLHYGSGYRDGKEFCDWIKELGPMYFPKPPSK